MDRPNPHDELITCENLVKIYKVAELETMALQGLDLAVRRGELLGIVGASGSGKTTLMNILGGLDRPTAGRLWVDGMDLLKMKDSALDHYRRTRVGFVWQQATRNLVPYLNALENVAMPLLLNGAPHRAAQRRAAELLELVGLAERQRHILLHLSGGEQQRVAVAVALANSPILLLADEPTGELDTATALTIYQTFQNLSRKLGVTIVIVSHDPGIAHHVERVVEVRDGKLASETVRRAAGPAPSTQSPAEHPTAGHPAHPEEFQKLVVLDSAGRLQLPSEYLEQYGIRRRARLELTEDGILVCPAQNGEEQPDESRPPASPPANQPAPQPQPGSSRWQRLFKLGRRA